jgi:hypothetical protein
LDMIFPGIHGNSQQRKLLKIPIHKPPNRHNSKLPIFQKFLISQIKI